MSAYREESLVRLSYDLEPEDLSSAWTPGRRNWFRGMRLSVAGVVAAVGAVYVLTLQPISALVMWILLGAAAAYFALKPKVKSDPLEAYGESWEDRRHVRLEVSEEVFAIADEVYETRLAWDVVLHWRETDLAFHVYTTPAQFHVIPKRVFPSTELQTTMRQLLSDRVTQGGQAAVDANTRSEWIPLAVYYGVFTLVLGALLEAVGRFASSL